MSYYISELANEPVTYPQSLRTSLLGFYRCTIATGALAQFCPACSTHVFQPTVTVVLNSSILNTHGTCDQLILVSPYYNTMKSTCFNH